jgi:hypoxanthine phosphoribosyltransferase
LSLTPEKARRVLETADVVCTAAEVSAAVARLAREISAALANEFPLVLCVMRGSVVFAGQLLPQLRFPLELDYLDLTRYGNATQGGEIEWRAAPQEAVAGRIVLVVDDILDEGHTLTAIHAKLKAAGSRRVLTAVLAVKDIGRPREVSPDFAGVTVPNRYVFGFGMDVSGAWRNLPEIYALTEKL